MRCVTRTPVLLTSRVRSGAWRYLPSVHQSYVRVEPRATHGCRAGWQRLGTIKRAWKFELESSASEAAGSRIAREARGQALARRVMARSSSVGSGKTPRATRRALKNKSRQGITRALHPPVYAITTQSIATEASGGAELGHWHFDCHFAHAAVRTVCGEQSMPCSAS